MPTVHILHFFEHLIMENTVPCEIKHNHIINVNGESLLNAAYTSIITCAFSYTNQLQLHYQIPGILMLSLQFMIIIAVRSINFTGICVLCCLPFSTLVNVVWEV